MALWRIAGPFPMKTWDGKPCTNFSSNWLWLDEFEGVICNPQWSKINPLAGEENLGTCSMHLDGTIAYITKSAGEYPKWSYDNANKTITGHYSSLSGTTEIHRSLDWTMLKKTAASQVITNPDVTISGAILDSPRRLFLADRQVLNYQSPSAEFSTIYGVDYQTGTPTPEYEVKDYYVPFANGVPAHWEPWTSSRFIPSHNKDRTAFLMDENGQKALEYDFVSKAKVGWTRRLGAQPDLTDPRIIAFAPKYKLWLVRDYYPQTDPGTGQNISYHRLTVFADKPYPATLSNPVALSPTAAGNSTKYRVRLTGADREPCAGHRVNWTASPVGEVIYPQTVTDADGYAETTVAYLSTQLGGPRLGTTITAEVTF